MINFSTCDKINTFLEKGEYDELRKFIDRERDKYYLSVASAALKGYMKQNPNLKGRFLYGNLADDARDLGKILISNNFSTYFLNTDILTPSLKEKGIEIKPDLFLPDGSIVYQRYSQTLCTTTYRKSKENALDVELIKQDKPKESKNSTSSVVKMFAQGRTIEHHFSIFEFAFTEQFLGTGRKGDIKYKLYPDAPIYLAESSMGKCLVMGLKRN